MSLRPNQSDLDWRCICFVNCGLIAHSSWGSPVARCSESDKSKYILANLSLNRSTDQYCGKTPTSQCHDHHDSRKTELRADSFAEEGEAAEKRSCVRMILPSLLRRVGCVPHLPAAADLNSKTILPELETQVVGVDSRILCHPSECSLAPWHSSPRMASFEM